MKDILLILAALILGTILASLIGCQCEPRTKRIEVITGTPDVWATEPKQKIEVKVIGEF